MPCKIMKNCGSGGSDKNKTKLACILEANESTRMRIGKLDTIKSRSLILQEKVKIHYSITIWCTNLFLCLKAMKIPAAKASGGQGMGKIGENFGVELGRKSKVRNVCIDEARTSGATVHFASLMDICHLKNAELEAKHQKYKGRVVLRGDIVKENSGSYAVFTEQGSSASQMTSG